MVFEAMLFPGKNCEARQPGLKVWVDLDREIGIKKSSAQISYL